MRRKITLLELRRAARRPWKRCAKGLATANAALPVSVSSAASSGHSANSNPMNVTASNAAAAAAAALNLAGLGPLSSSSPQQAMAAILQQQMMAQNLPLLTNNHFASSTSFLGMSPNNSGSSTSKLTR